MDINLSFVFALGVVVANFLCIMETTDELVILLQFPCGYHLPPKSGIFLTFGLNLKSVLCCVFSSASQKKASRTGKDPS